MQRYIKIAGITFFCFNHSFGQVFSNIIKQCQCQCHVFDVLLIKQEQLQDRP